MQHFPNIFFAPLQAAGFWQWSDFLRHQAVNNGREPLFINLDETVVSMSSPDAKGLVVSKRWWKGSMRPGQPISMRERRSMVSHVGLCTHRTDAQGRLPQIFTGNTRCFTLPLMAALAAILPSNVQFWRCTSSWNTSNLMLEILTEISRVMAEFPSLQPILVMDAAPIHLTRAVIQATAALNIWLLIVPARATYALQPLDTHAFPPHKAFLRRAYRDAKDANGVVTPLAWAKTLIMVVRQF